MDKYYSWTNYITCYVSYILTEDNSDEAYKQLKVDLSEFDSHYDKINFLKDTFFETIVEQIMNAPWEEKTNILARCFNDINFEEVLQDIEEKEV